MRGDFWQFLNKYDHIWDHFFPLLFPKDSESLKILDIQLWEVGAKRPLNGTSKVKKIEEEKKLHGNFRQFSNKNVHIWDHFVPFFSPKDSESLKILDIWLWEVGAKRRLNGTSKVNRRTDGHTDTQTDRQTDILTYRKHRPRGQMLWKFELNFSSFTWSSICSGKMNLDIKMKLKLDCQFHSLVNNHDYVKGDYFDWQKYGYLSKVWIYI